MKKYLQIALIFFLTVCAIIVFYDSFYGTARVGQIIQKFTEVTAPILYGLFLAYLLMPVVHKVELGLYKIFKKSNTASKRQKTIRWIAVLLTWLLLLAIIYAVCILVIPSLIASLTLLIGNLRDYYKEVVTWGESIADNAHIKGIITEGLIKRYYESITQYLSESILPKAESIATTLSTGVISGVLSTVNFAKDLVIGLIVSVYVLVAKDSGRIAGKNLIFAIFSAERAELVLTGIKRIDAIFSGFLRGKILDSAIIGIICLIGCSLLRIPYAPIIGLVVGITNVIPFFGPFLGAIPCSILVLLDSPLKCLTFVIFIIILQQIDGNIIGPKILGERTGISSFWVIVAIVVGGGYFGIIGMFIGVPVCACIQTLIKYIINTRLASKNLSLTD